MGAWGWASGSGGPWRTVSCRRRQTGVQDTRRHPDTHAAHARCDPSPPTCHLSSSRLQVLPPLGVTPDCLALPTRCVCPRREHVYGFSPVPPNEQHP